MLLRPSLKARGLEQKSYGPFIPAEYVLRLGILVRPPWKRLMVLLSHRDLQPDQMIALVRDERGGHHVRSTPRSRGGKIPIPSGRVGRRRGRRARRRVRRGILCTLGEKIDNCVRDN